MTRRLKPGGRQKAPTSIAELRARIEACGYKVKPGGKHQRVERPDGTMLMPLAYTPSDWRTVINTWSHFRKLLAGEGKPAPL